MTTDIVERYLEAVAAQLPAAEREDIVAELRDLILSRVEGREEELGRALEEAEIEAILREVGHPLVVAARYRKGPDSLIGPELFPYWLFGMKAGLIVIAAIQALGLVFGVIGDPTNFGQFIGRALQGFISSGLTVAGALTIAGAVMEHYGMKPGWLTKWRVSDLPAFGLADPAKWGAAFSGSEKSKTDWLPDGGRMWGLAVKDTATTNALWSLVGNIIFGLLLIGAIYVPWISTLGLASGTTVTLAPIWASLRVLALIWVMWAITVDIFTLVTPSAKRAQAALKIPMEAGWMVTLWMLLQAGHWFTLARQGVTARVEGGLQHIGLVSSADGVSLSENIRQVTSGLRALHEAGESLSADAYAISTVMSWGILLMMIGVALSMLGNLWRMVRGA